MSKKFAESTPKLIESTKHIDVYDLVVNTKNPRILYYLDNPTQEQACKLMMDEFDIRSLKKRILTDGQVHEPLCIKYFSKNKWLVHDGNSRTVAVLSILDDIKNGRINGIVEKDFRKMRCEVIRSNATEAEIRKLRTQKHVAGAKPWEQIAQAGDIYLMIKQDQETEQSVADHLGFSKSEVRKFHRAFSDTIDYGKQHGGKFQKTFIYWYEFNSNPILQAEAKDDSGFRDQFMKWIADGKIISHKQIRGIARWYKGGNDKARKKALAEMNRPKGTAKEAIELFNELSLESALTVLRKTKKILNQFVGSKLLSDEEKVELHKEAKELQKKVKSINAWIKSELANKAGKIA